MTVVEFVFDVLILAHVATGFVGLVAFWIPVFARKGGRVHVQAGRVFTYCAYVVTLSAVTASVGRIGLYQAQGIGFADRPQLYGFAFFLGYLGVVTFAAVRHGVRMVETRKSPERLRTPFHAALAWVSIGSSIAVIGLAFAAWSGTSPILLALSPVGVMTGSNILKVLRSPKLGHMEWFYAHMGSMLTSGIAFHTAFAVFGSQRLWAYDIAGPLAVVPWILPAVVGIPAQVIWIRYYRRKFGPVPVAA